MNKLRAFTMPKWGIEMQEGTLSEWSIREGESFEKGRVIAQIETEKIVNEVTAEYSATLVKQIAQVGSTYPVGALLAVLAIDSVAPEEIAAFVSAYEARHGGEPAAQSRTAEQVTVPAEQAADRQASRGARALAARLGVNLATLRGSGRGGRITLQDVDQAAKPARALAGSGRPVSIEPATLALDTFYASPLAKRLALQHRIDLSSIRGTGLRGRISRSDVAQAARIGSPSGEATILKMSPLRKVIARQLSLSKATIPHFYLRADVSFDALLDLRAQAKERGGTVPSVNDYLVRACALALMKVPDVNIQVHGDEIHRFADADIAIAVSTDRGLVTPIIRRTQSLSLTEVAECAHSALARARAGRLNQQDLEGGTFTLSNLGMYGVDQFDAIINPPQGAILAVGAVRRRPVERDGQLALGNLGSLSLSCDHRAIDGALGAIFLSTLKELIEAPRQL